jgi:hypothetical protein
VRPRAKKTTSKLPAQLLGDKWASAWGDVDRIERQISALRVRAARATPAFVRFRHYNSRFGCAEGPRSYPYVEFNGRESRGINDDGSIHHRQDCVWSMADVLKYVAEGTWIIVATK